MALVEVAAGVAVELAGGEHVPAGAEDRVLDGALGGAVAAAHAEATVLGLEVAVVGARRGLGGFGECTVEPFGALACAARFAFAAGLVVAGALAGPGGEVVLGGEPAHVGADLGDHDLSGARLDAGDRAQELNGRRERAQLFLDRCREPLFLLIEEVEVGEDRGDDKRVVRVETAFQRLVRKHGSLGG